jgi:flagellar motor switch protein FliN/FliY
MADEHTSIPPENAPAPLPPAADAVAQTRPIAAAQATAATSAPAEPVSVAGSASAPATGFNADIGAGLESAAVPVAPPAESRVPAANLEPAMVGARFSLTPQAAGPADVPQFVPEPSPQALTDISLLDDVELNVKIELGRTQMPIEDVLRLAEGSVIELDKLAGDPVDIFVNERLVARGEVLVLNENFCVRVNDIVSALSEAEDGH